MSQDTQIHIGPDAIPHLVEFCRQTGAERFTVIADANTQSALGARVVAELRAADLRVTSIVLRGDDVIADEKYLMAAMFQAPPTDQTFVAVGSGTVTDIARYVSFRTRNPFISVPTAASVDGFVSTVAPLVSGGFKDTYPAQAPIAVFADLPTLVSAPAELTAAGFGDIVGKTTSLADWQLGHLLWNEPFDPAIEQRVRRTLNHCMEAADAVASGSEQGVRALIDALIDSGLCMLAFGDSRPASGAEHHCSHYWEMQLLQEGRPAILHGAKVGYATSLIAGLYDRIRRITQPEARQLAAQAPYQGPDRDIEAIRQAYGAGAEQILAIQQPFLELTAAEYHDLQQQIVDHWAEIQVIAASVLPASTVVELLQTVGAPTDTRSLGLEERMVEPALQYGHYVRNRFTIVKLCRLLGIDVRPGS